MVWLKRAGVVLLLAGAFYGLDWVLSHTVIEYVVRIILLCGINVILAVGLNLINGTTGQFSIGHAGFMAVGAYGTAVTVIALERAVTGHAGGEGIGWVASQVIFNVGLLAGAVLAGLAGVMVGVPSLRLRGDYLAIVTLGFGEVIRLLFNNSEALGGATGYSGGRAAGLPIYSNVFWVFLWTVAIVALIRNLTFSSYGRTLEAIREDEIASDAVGLPTTRLKVLAFTVSSMAAGIAGGLFAHLQSTVNPNDFKFDRSIDLIVMIIVGGLGSVTGAVVGAIFVTVTLEVMRPLGDYRLVVYPLVLVIMMIVRPQGILGKWELSPSKLLRRKAKPEAAKP